MRFWNFFWQVFKILKMGGFDEKILGQPRALESGFKRIRLSLDFFMKSEDSLFLRTNPDVLYYEPASIPHVLRSFKIRYTQFILDRLPGFKV